ncbi:MAG: hypothetical protein HUU22_10075 [Phycisphaerae bacterium]|nr:hypothetical protein [Phycisphaerae bacterium]NUQ46369.1 hypothetical protein [Phycisphaerae bacterium]
MLIALAAALAGCEAPVKIQPGLSGARITIQAKPKSGYHRPVAGVSGVDPYGMSTPASVDDEVPQTGAFALVDYDHLDDIVVWLEPQNRVTPDAVPPDITLDVATPDPAGPPLFATGVGGVLRVRNTGRRAESVYSVSEGNEFDLGALPAGGMARSTLHRPGVVEVLLDSRNEPLARVYVAPSPWVRRARGGQSVVFADLPPGAYRAACWHPRLPGTEQNVQLRADQLTRVTLVVGVDALARSR